MSLKIERYIQGSWLTGNEDAISYILKNLHHAIVNIAPHQKDNFDTAYPRFTIEYTDSTEWRLEALSSMELIIMSRGVAELVWCVSYSYLGLYTEIAEGKQFFKEKNKVSLHSNTEISKYTRLLKWSYERWFNNSSESWPNGLPKPVSNPKKGTIENSANELTYCILSFFIHHELAHIKLHKGIDVGIKQEEEADRYATDWILNSDLPEDELLFQKQALGVAIGFDILIARCIHTGDCGEFDHPHSFDRLISNLQRHINYKNHRVWSTLCFTLKLHLDTAKYKTPELVYDSFKDCIDSYHKIVKNT